MAKSFKSMRLPLAWTVVTGCLIALIQAGSALTPPQIVALIALAGMAASWAAWQHGWFRAPMKIGSPLRFVVVSALLWAPFLYIGYRIWPEDRPITDVKASGLKLGIAATGTAIGNQHALATVFATVRNSGPPSIATNWTLELILPSGEKHYYPPFVITDPTTTLSSSLGSAVYKTDDLLYRKTSTTPIPTGGMVPGFLVFNIDPVTQAQADAVGTVFHLSAVDINGNTIFAEHRVQGNFSDKFVYMPGTQEPQITFKK